MNGTKWIPGFFPLLKPARKVWWKFRTSPPRPNGCSPNRCIIPASRKKKTYRLHIWRCRLSWWFFHQPIWKILSSQKLDHFPRGENIFSWNHHLGKAPKKKSLSGNSAGDLFWDAEFHVTRTRDVPFGRTESWFKVIIRGTICMKHEAWSLWFLENEGILRWVLYSSKS